MNSGAQLQSYRQISLETAPPGQLVLMLYDGALRFLGEAIQGFEVEDPLERNLSIHNNIQKTQDILSELIATLDMEAGGEVADNLRDLYWYIYNRLQDSNIRKELAGVEEASQRITVLRDAWAEMLSNMQTSGGGVGDISSLAELAG